MLLINFHRLIVLALSLAVSGQTLGDLGFIRYPSSGVFVEQKDNVYQSSKFYVRNDLNELYVTVDGDDFKIETDDKHIKCGLLDDEVVVDELCETKFALGDAKWFRFIFNQPSQIRAIKVVNNATNAELRLVWTVSHT